MRSSNPASLLSALGNIHASPAKDNIEVHAIDTDGGVILDTQVDVFLDTESEVSVV